MAAERLQKLIAQAGIASRRAAERLIRAGKVQVNGVVVRELGTKADPKVDRIQVEGRGTLEGEPLVYIAMNKPIHVLCTLADPGGRPTVLDVLQASRAVRGGRHEGGLPRVYPVGRLDFDAEGLLLLTNDGDLAARLTHPRHHVPKTYLVKVKGRPQPEELARLRQGVRLPDENGRPSGRPTAPASVEVEKSAIANTWLTLTITEGRTHQVKRMCQEIGRPVLRLLRTSVGGLEIGDLEPGQWRFLDKAEVAALKSRAGGVKESGAAAARAPAEGRRAAYERGRRRDPKRSRSPRAH